MRLCKTLFQTLPTISTQYQTTCSQYLCSICAVSCSISRRYLCSISQYSHSISQYFTVFTQYLFVPHRAVLQYRLPSGVRRETTRRRGAYRGREQLCQTNTRVDNNFSILFWELFYFVISLTYLIVPRCRLKRH